MSQDLLVPMDIHRTIPNIDHHPGRHVQNHIQHHPTRRMLQPPLPPDRAPTLSPAQEELADVPGQRHGHEAVGVVVLIP